MEFDMHQHAGRLTQLTDPMMRCPVSDGGKEATFGQSVIPVAGPRNSCHC